MSENNRKSENLSETLSRLPIGSPESRAAARALLQDPDRMPIITVEFVRANLDSDGRVIGPPICDRVRAVARVPGAPDRPYSRRDDETAEEFKERIIRDLPVRYEGRELWADRGGPGLGCMSIIFWPREESTPGAKAST